MEDRKDFVENSQIALKGTLNGVFGSVLYETILLLFVLMIITISVRYRNPGVEGEQLSDLTTSAIEAFPNAIITCLASAITFIVFIYIIKWARFKVLLKKSFCLKVLKYGFISFLVIFLFHYVYSFFLLFVLNLEFSSNTNQDSVVSLIQASPIIAFFPVVIIAPIVEEFTYRYCVFGELSKRKKWLGYLVSASIFGLMHFISSYMKYGFAAGFWLDLSQLPLYIFPGLVFCYVYDKSDNFGSCCCGHIINNLYSYFMVVLSLISL